MKVLDANSWLELKTNKDSFKNSIELTVKVPEATSPSAIGLSADERILGVGLHSIQLIYK